MGFVLTRTTGLPQAKGDIGNWSEPLGLAALFVEGAVIAVAGYALAALRPVAAVRPPRPRQLRRRALTSTFAEPLPTRRDPAAMPHLSELHGAATHLAVVAVPVYLLILLVRRSGRGGAPLAAAEPWIVGAAVAGVALAGLTGLLVWGQSKTELRGGSGTARHRPLLARHRARRDRAWPSRRWRFRRASSDRHTHGLELSPEACSRWWRCSRRATSAAA